MIDALPLLLGPEGYQISRSVRLRSSASAYFNRTSGTPTSGSIFTHSFWVKRGVLGAQQTLISGQRPTNFDRIYFTASDTLVYQWNDGTSNLLYLETTQVFRDPSAWYHIVVATDTTQATSSNRAKIYINGVQVTAFSTATYPTQNSTSYLNRNATTLNLGRTTTAAFYLDGYLTEVNFIDGQALTPSSFGETNAVTGVWQPKKYTGTYGTNGFYLNFSDNSAATAAAIGKDYSGNGNNWTPNNISVTAGVTYDSMLDVPTQWADGGNGRGNYWTFNPLVPVSGATYSNANLQYTNSGNNRSGFAPPLPTAGKWYWEGTWITNGGGSAPVIGISQFGYENTQGAAGLLGYRSNGNKFDQAGTETAYGASWTTGDIIGIAVDMDSGTIAFYKNGVSQGTAFTTVLTALTQPVSPQFRVNVAGDVLALNFGQRPFAYTPPTGFKALNTLNLPTPTILKGNQYFDATTYTGNGIAIGSGGLTISSLDFQPDLVWVKNRSLGAAGHILVDRVRDVGNYLSSNSTAAEGNTGETIEAFTSDGFTVGSGNAVNRSGDALVSWNWKANGSGVSNTDGSITSQVSVGGTQGFSIVTYTGTGANATVGHGLGVAPRMMIVKNRTTAGLAWIVYHASFTTPATQALYLNVTNAVSSSSAYWNNTVPTSSVFSIAAYNPTNQNTNAIVAYCFADVEGYSKFGSYVGNGSTDGPFVFCGFRPRFIMVKRTDSTSNWTIHDTSRNGYNVANADLRANTSDAEVNPNANTQNDILSNGFKVRHTSGVYNANGGTYIFAAFAENPFKNALAR